MAPLRRTAAAAVLLAAATSVAGAECPMGPRLVCTLSPTAGNKVGGSITLTPTTTADGTCTTALAATVTGLAPGSVHGWHIHEFGDISGATGLATGGHFNFNNVPHGLPSSQVRHVGDLGNLTPASAAGVATAGKGATSELAVTSLVVGRGLIVHTLRDDGGQPTGNAGSRLAQCVLGVAPTVVTTPTPARTPTPTPAPSDRALVVEESVAPTVAPTEFPIVILPDDTVLPAVVPTPTPASTVVPTPTPASTVATPLAKAILAEAR